MIISQFGRFCLEIGKKQEALSLFQTVMDISNNFSDGLPLVSHEEFYAKNPKGDILKSLASYVESMGDGIENVDVHHLLN